MADSMDFSYSLFSATDKGENNRGVQEHLEYNQVQREFKRNLHLLPCLLGAGLLCTVKQVVPAKACLLRQETEIQAELCHQVPRVLAVYSPVM